MRHHAMLIALLAVTSLAAAQGSFFRATDGKWKPLKTTTSGAACCFSLTPADIGGGSTTIILNKPPWMVLDDTAPPVFVKVLLDGQERPVGDLDLGQLAAPPGEFAFAVRDEKNPLEPAVRVTANDMPLPAEQVTVAKLAPDGKYLRVAAKLGALPAARYTILATATDRAPAPNSATLKLVFNTAPLLTNGGFEQLRADGKAVGWDWGCWSEEKTSKYELGVAAGGAEGEKAFRFNGLEPPLNLVCYQNLPPLKPDMPYVLSGQYKSAAGAAVSVITTVKGEAKAEYLTQSFPKAAEWTPFSYEFKLKPHESVMIVVRTGSKGETWFDDLKLVAK